jgi:LacI family transcriptional regulator
LAEGNVVEISTVLERPTIQDVAAAAGVSTGTVSRVLNGRPGVKAATRAHVLETVSRLEYRPDSAARQLSGSRSKRIGFHVSARHGRFSPFYMLFMEYLIAGFQGEGYRLEDVPSRPDGLPAHLPEGMVLFGVHDDDTRIPYLEAAGVPFVLEGHAPGQRWVRSDDYGGGKEATEHLVRLGHHDILHLGGDPLGQGAFERWRGYQDALAAHSLAPRPPLDGGFTTLGAYRALRRVLEGGVSFSAIFAASDEMAQGAIAALEDAGLRVPGDVSLVGFDDLPEFGERLTTVRQDIARVAETAVTLLKEGLRGEPVRHEIVPVQLVVRGTTARRRSTR